MGTAALLSACSATDGLMTSVELPAGTSQPANAPKVGAGLQQPPLSQMVVTGHERAYLDALAQGGVHPSSELLALSIGSYICQAQAAGQSREAVWDYIYPLVHNDVRNAHMTATAPSDADVDAAAQSYIRIATDRLC
jgi:Protein of unknown function (DUF732)